MDNSNWRPTQGVSGGPVGDPSMESGDWRAQLQADSRQMIVNKIMETLKRHLPFSGHEGLQELKKIAVRFEEKIYTAATSQSDYLHKISLKMPTMETRSQNPMPDPMQATSGLNPADPGSQVMPQVNMQGQQLPIPVPSQSGQQQMMPQNMQNNIGSHYLYQQQLQQMAKLKLQQNNINTAMQSQMLQQQKQQQQQQQNLLQSGMQPTMMQTPSLSGVVQNQQAAVPESSSQYTNLIHRLNDFSLK